MEDGWQNRPQQKLDVIHCRIRQHVLFDDERPWREDVCGRRVGWQRGRGCRDRRLKSTRSDVSGSEVLLVVKDDDLRPPPSHDVSLEIWWNVDRADRRA